MEHLSLEIFDREGTGSSYATLPEDASIGITDTSQVFAKGDLWSLPFTLDVRANAHIFGTAGDIHGARLHEQLDRRRARLWAEGVPMFLGYIRLGSETDVEGDTVDVTFEGGSKTFEDMIDGGRANQVPLMGDVLIGMALWRKRWAACEVKLQAYAAVHGGEGAEVSGSFATEIRNVKYQPVSGSGTIGDTVGFACDGENDGESTQEYPRMVFPTGEFEADATGVAESVACINTDQAYGEDPETHAPLNPYCNVALCYQRQGYERKDTSGNVTTDYNSEPEAQRGYEYMPADRVNSAPNFYVIYWLRALMKHLGILVEENQMLGVEDMRRLFFVNTKCAYEEPKKLRTVAADSRFGKYRFGSARTPDRLVPEYFGAYDQDGGTYKRAQNVSAEDSGFTCTSYNILEDNSNGYVIDKIVVKVAEVEDWHGQDRTRYERNNNYLHKAYATSECFPDADISEVVRALEAGFGIRFLFSEDYRRVRIVLLRNLFRSRDVQDIACDITGEGKTENGKRGFRMTYGDADDTAFHYKGFDDLLPHKPETWKDTSDKHDYSHWKLDAEYGEIIKRVSAFDKTCYVTPETGNAYIIKVDKDAKRYQELHPSLFEGGGYMDAEDGDCTGEEDTIETVSVGFKPAIMNDLNMEAERLGGRQQRFALFVGETMRPRRPDLKMLSDGSKTYDDPEARYPIYGSDGLYGEDSVAKDMKSEDGIVKPGEFAIRSDMFAEVSGNQLLIENLPLIIKFPDPVGDRKLAEWKLSLNVDGHVSEGYRLYLQDNYEPNDDGVSPVETHDWGLTLGIMRGSGGDADVSYMPDPDDHEGNDTWETVPGSSVTAHPDTCDNYGTLWDYNGVTPGPGSTDGRISLKLRAEKPNPEFDPTKPEDASNRRYLEILNADGTRNQELSGRGLADQFYREYSYWVRNARIWRGRVRMELAQLLAIDKTKRVRVGDVTGFVRKMEYTVSNKTGLGLVTMEIMYI